MQVFQQHFCMGQFEGFQESFACLKEDLWSGIFLAAKNTNKKQ